MIDADADPALVGPDIVDAIRDRLAQGLVHEVVNAHEFGRSLGLPFASAVLEIAKEFLLFRIDRNRRVVAILKALHLVVDVLELGVAVRVLRPFTRLTVALEAVVGRMQQPSHGRIADRVPLARQLPSQSSGAGRSG